MPSSTQPWQQRWSDLIAQWSTAGSPTAAKPWLGSDGWRWPSMGTMSATTGATLRSLSVALQEHQMVLGRRLDVLAVKGRQTSFRAYQVTLQTASPAWIRVQALLETMSLAQAVIAVCLGSLLLLLLFLLLVRSSSSRRMEKLSRGLSKSSEKRLLYTVGEDSDERDDFEDEDEGYADDGKGQEGGVMRRFRSALRSRGSTNYSNGGEKTQRRRPNSIIRITSSDPRSRLSVQAIQMDLDPNNSQVRLGSVRSNSSGNSSDGGSGSSSVTRRRRESGRLSSGSDTGGSPNPGSSASSLSRTVHTAGRAAKQRRMARNGADPERKRMVHDNSGGQRSSISSDDGRMTMMDSTDSLHSFSSALTGGDTSWEYGTIYEGGPLKLASILRREPQFYASLPHLPLVPKDDPSSSTERGSAGDAASSSWKHSSTSPPLPPLPLSAQSDDNAAFSVLPTSNSLHTRQGRLPPGAGRPMRSPHGSNSPPIRLGTLTPDQMKSIWPEKKARTVKLREPDWRPYVEVHERARERLEKYAELQLLLPGERSESPMCVAGSSASEEGSGNSSHAPPLEDDAFWYEKYTRSTAASGRDWDWRKRRARQAALKRAASLDGAAFATKMLPNEPDEIGGRSTSMGYGNTAANGSAQTRDPPRLEVKVNGDRIDFNSSTFPWSNGTATGAFDQAASSPGFTPNKRNRSFSDTDQRDADKAMSVPGRLSSLKPKGGVRRMLSRRERPGLAGAEGRSSPAASSDPDVPNGWSRSLELTTGDGRSITANAALHSRMRDSHQDALRKSTSLANLNSRFTDSAPDLHDVRRGTAAPAPNRVARSRQSLEHHVTMQPSPLAAAQPQLAWSSADAYGSSSATRPRQNGVRSNSLFATPDVRNVANVPRSDPRAMLTADQASTYGNRMFAGPPPSAPLPTLPDQGQGDMLADQRPVRPQRRGTEPSTRAAPAMTSLPRLSIPSNPADDVRPSSPSRRAILTNARTASQRRAFPASPDPQLPSTRSPLMR